MKTRKLYGVLMFFVFASSFLFAVGIPYLGLAFAEERPVNRAYGGLGLLETPLIAGQTIDAGIVRVWNSREKLHIQVEPSGEWRINTIQIYVGLDPVPTVKGGNPNQGKFPYKKEYPDPAYKHTLVLDLVEDLGFSWGEPYEYMRIQNIAVHAELVQLADPVSNRGQNPQSPRVVAKEGAWAFGPNEFEGGRWGWWFNYEMAHPKRGHFIGSPVGGLSYKTPTFCGFTDDSGGFDYFPGERVELAIGSVHLGNPIAGHKISPLDIFEAADTEDPRVINMARFLQSLDADASPKDGINITADVVVCLEQTMQELGLTSLDFSVDAQIDSVIQGTIGHCTGLVAVSAEDAKANLDKSLDSNMFRKNVSRTPDMASAKAKLNIMNVWLPALRANDDPAYYIDDSGNIVDGIPYYDADGNFIRDEKEAKPIVVIYCDEVETGAHDVFASISRDDGHTWKRKNISRMADRSSFTLANGQPYYGHCKKPVFQVKGNKILVAWTTKFAKGGKPRYSITTCDDPDTEEIETANPETGLCRVTCHGDGDNEVCEPDYPHDDDYYADDIWGVSGPQRSVDYIDQGYPEVGEVPYSAVWIARAVIADNGDIIWYKPERLTSGRRDANQNFCAGADGAGFAVTWQEDPKGLRPGEAKGPGPGWGGATTNHKTDIWYSYVTWGDFAVVDMDFEPGGDPEHDDEDFIGRPKALVPMSLPVRVSDNNAASIGNMKLRLYSNGYPVVYDDGDIANVTLMNVNDGRATVGVGYDLLNLTRCVKFEGGATISETVLPELPADHNSNMHCTNCHVPYEEENVDIIPPLDPPQQGSPLPLVVVDGTMPEPVYLGGFTNSDCASCHYDHIVPRDRVIAVAQGTDEEKCAECENKGGIWKDGTQGGDNETIEAYYPYDGYPYIAGGDDSLGSYRYGYMLDGMCDTYKQSVIAAGGNHLLEPDWNNVDLSNWHDFVNQQGVEKRCLVTDDKILLDGNTGAARSNLFLQTYTKDGKKSAWAIMAYEETKGVGLGPPEDTGTGGEPQDGSGYDPYETFPDEGKNAIYHSFDF
ncbi:MAG: choice-of-anchor O protein, partial [Deltaproteobacteria bacterium]|nr:choice-of-anchor O protein [Deltaproteobacteria bacterium]